MDDMIQATPTPPGRQTVGRPVKDDLASFRRSMGRFRDIYAVLPVGFPATCPVCRDVVSGVFEQVGRQVVLTYRCDRCGPNREVHADAIWSPGVSDFPGSADRTLGGEAIQPVLRRLPRTVETLCPDCSAVVLGRYFVEGGAVHIEKGCPEHGHFRDCVNSDVELQSRAAWWTFEEHAGQGRAPRDAEGCCPSDCGLCSRHQSASCLAQIDLTNRCDMRCPVCFANAGATGRVVQGDYEQILAQLRALREMDPHPATAIQFTGGEPTLHPDFLRIIAAADGMGFSHIQIATNGLRIGDEGLALAAAEAGFGLED
ncbi:hypothetical protein LCGC14_2701380 [marine sediment metagenome]|uniref:Radical SAM core domain-containing protein n=1 Tax=marine sediment metagenome TaxID=412755 RepID=A0A0F8ZFM8_9ZZZZ